MLVAWGVFALNITVKLGALTKMAPENRLNDISKRIGRLFKIGFGQLAAAARQPVIHVAAFLKLEQIQ